MNKPFLLLASLRFVKLSTSVLVLILYGRVFGIGLHMDSWVFASGVIATVGLALWGPLNEVVRSRYVRQVSEAGPKAARQAATSLLAVTTTASVFVCAALYLTAPNLVAMLFASNEPTAHGLVLNLFLLMLPSIVISQVLNLGTAYMNCHGMIYTPEFMGIAAAGINFVGVLLLSPWMGMYSLPCGYYAGIIVSLLIVLRFLYVHRYLHCTHGPRAVINEFCGALMFASPLFMSYLAGQLNGLLEKYIASLMGVGVISSINYASQIKSTLQAVLTTVMFSLIVPRLTQAALQDSSKRFDVMLKELQNVALLFLLIVLPPVVGGADAIAAVLFGNASAAGGEVQEIASLIRLYAATLVPVALFLVYGVALLAQQKAYAYAVLGVAAQLLSALICVGLFRVLGAEVFPWALLLSHLAVALLMLKYVDTRHRVALLAWAFSWAAAISATAFLATQVFQSLAQFFSSKLLGAGIVTMIYITAVAAVGCIVNATKRRDHGQELS